MVVRPVFSLVADWDALWQVESASEQEGVGAGEPVGDGLEYRQK